jgi:very-short-patch-repair endonuclease
MMMMNCQKCGREIINLGGLVIHEASCNGTPKDVEVIKQLYLSGLSVRKLKAKGYGQYQIKYALKNIVRRSGSTAAALAHKLYPNEFKHSDKSKEKMRQSKLLFYKRNPEAATSWRQKSLSYPEKLFQQLIEKNELTKKYDIVREYSFFPYFVDFAFINIKLAIEIDGSQHWKVQSKIDRDKAKEQLLIASNWKVYRIPEFLIKKGFEKV